MREQIAAIVLGAVLIADAFLPLRAPFVIGVLFVTGGVYGIVRQLWTTRRSRLQREQAERTLIAAAGSMGTAMGTAVGEQVAARMGMTAPVPPTDETRH